MFLFGIYNVTSWGEKARTLFVRFYLTSTGSLVPLLLFIGGDGMQTASPIMERSTFFEV